MDILKLSGELLDKYFNKDKKDTAEFMPHAERYSRIAAGLGLVNFKPDNTGFTSRNDCNPYSVYLTDKYLNSLGLPIEDFYRLNSYGYRSDDFLKNHLGLHVLFAGCSITFGDSIPEEYSWARKVFNMLSDIYQISGYYNIGSPGSGLQEISALVEEYCDQFGVPDVLFLNLPGLDRGGLLNDCLLTKLKEDLLDKGCEVYDFSWDDSAVLDHNAPAYPKSYKFYSNDLLKHIYSFDYDCGMYNSFIMKAMDDAHPGIAEHDFYARFIYNEFINNTGKVPNDQSN